MDSNHRIGVLQTPALTTWRRRPIITNLSNVFKLLLADNQDFYYDYTILK